MLNFTNSCLNLCLALMHILYAYILYLHLCLGILVHIPNAKGALLTNVGLKKKKKKFSYEEFKTDKVSLAGCLCLDQK